MVTEIYYIGRGQGGSTATKNNIGQDVWSLWRKTSDEAPVELVEGIEDLEVLFGIDTTGANNVDAANRYVTFDQVGNNAIRALRVTVVASSVDAIDGVDALRRTFSQTITYRNG
jgi:type IV pilus assembly protein PilW